MQWPCMSMLEVLPLTWWRTCVARPIWKAAAPMHIVFRIVEMSMLKSN